MNEKQIQGLLEERIGELIIEKKNLQSKNTSRVGRAISELQFVLMAVSEARTKTKICKCDHKLSVHNKNILKSGEVRFLRCQRKGCPCKKFKIK